MESGSELDKPALVASLKRLATRADEFGRSSWLGPSRAELEKAIFGVEPLLSSSIDLGKDAEGLRQELQSSCRALLAKMKTTKVDAAQFDVDSRSIVQTCNRMLSLL